MRGRHPGVLPSLHRWTAKQVQRHGSNGDKQVDTIEERSREAGPIPGRGPGRALARSPALAVHGSRAGIHRRQQLETGWIARTTTGPRHRHFASFQGLAQRLERGTGELWQLIKE